MFSIEFPNDKNSKKQNNEHQQTGAQRARYALCDWVKKVAHTLLHNVGFRSWSRFLAVSLQAWQFLRTHARTDRRTTRKHKVR